MQQNKKKVVKGYFDPEEVQMLLELQKYHGGSESGILKRLVREAARALK